MAKNKKKRSGREAVAAKRHKKSSIEYKCMDCSCEEKIPVNALEMLEVFDDGLGSPTFKCKSCGGTMEAVEEERAPTSGIVIHKEFDERELEGDWLF